MNFRTSSSLVLTALACAVVGHAQTSMTSGALRGAVKAKKGGAVASAAVGLRNVETAFPVTPSPMPAAIINSPSCQWAPTR